MASSLLAMLVSQQSNKRKQSEPAAPMEFKLSTLDQVMDRNYTTFVYFYRTAPGVHPKDIFSYVYEAFQLTTTEIPILRGHIATYNHHNGYATVRVDPSKPFPVAMRDLTTASGERGVWKHGSMSDLEARSFPNVAVNDPALRPPQVIPGDGAPVFVVQITFIDGGMVFFNAVSHVWADLTAANTMYATVSKHCAALSRGQKVAPRPLPAESFDRTRLSTGLDVDLPIPVPDEEELAAAAADGPREDYISSTWRIPAARLGALKAHASTPGSGVWISTGDAVNALFWRSLAQSPAFKALGKDSSRAAVAIDFRQRLAPPIPMHYFGNAATAVMADLDADELARPGEAALREIALRLRSTIKDWDGDAEIPLAIGMINAGEKLSVAQRSAAFEAFGGHDILFADHSKAHVYRFDWGVHISKLLRLRELGLWGAPPVSPVMNMYPLDVDGNAEIRTSLRGEVLEWMLQDKELGEWVEIVDTGLGDGEDGNNSKDAAAKSKL